MNDLITYNPEIIKNLTIDNLCKRKREFMRDYQRTWDIREKLELEFCIVVLDHLVLKVSERISGKKYQNKYKLPELSDEVKKEILDMIRRV